MTPTPPRATPAAQSDNAKRYVQWASEHWFWRDHKAELDEMLDAQIAEKEKKRGDP